MRKGIAGALLFVLALGFSWYVAHTPGRSVGGASPTLAAHDPAPAPADAGLASIEGSEALVAAQAPAGGRTAALDSARIHGRVLDKRSGLAIGAGVRLEFSSAAEGFRERVE